MFEPVSEQHLLASLASARQSITSLEQANKELLEALQNSQNIIDSLSNEGMSIQQQLFEQSEKISILEMNNSELNKENLKLSSKLEASTDSNSIKNGNFENLVNILYENYEIDKKCYSDIQEKYSSLCQKNLLLEKVSVKHK